MNLKSTIKELKKRNVFKSALAYLAVAWILLQVFSILLPMVESPKWILKTITIILFVGFPFWLLFSWSYQFTSEGLIKNENIDSGNSKSVWLLYSIFFLIIIAPITYLILKPSIKKEKIKTFKEESLTEQKGLTTNLVALDFYKRGEFYHKKQSFSDINLAIKNYQKAIENDSLFAMAYNNLGSAYMRKNLSFDPNTKWEEEAYSAAGKALQLDPNLANPHIIQGQFYWSPSHNFAHEEAIKEFNKAIFKDSTISQSYEQLSLVQLHIGLFDKALKNARNSVLLDPGNYRARRFIAEIFLFQGKYKEALEEFNKIPKSFESQPTQAFKGLTYFYLNETEKAIQLLEENLVRFPNSPHLNSVYAIILSSNGKNNKALEKMKISEQNTVDFIHAHHIYYYLGVASALLGDHNASINWLQKAADSGFPNYPLFNSDPNLQSLKESVGFNKLISKLKKDWQNYKAI